MRFSLIIFFFFSTLSSYTSAQSKIDTVALGEFTVESTRIKKPLLNQPVQITMLDSARLVFAHGADLGDLLSQYTSLYIRNNGPGAASVISQRGFGGSQTRVLWEGMPINHQMLGVTDLSLLPANAFNGVEVTSGSGSSLYGSGISGTVYLQNNPTPNRVSLGQSVGSFGNFITNGTASAQAGDFTVALYGSTQNNDNNFRYYDQNSGSEENRSRGSFENDQVIGSLKWKRGSMVAKSSLWWNRADHEITENIYAGAGAATQYDESLRWVNNFKMYTSRFLWEAKIYAGETTLNYFNPPIGINSLSESREVSSEISATYFSSESIELTGNISGTLTEVETNNYPEIKTREQFSTGMNASLTPLEKLKIYPAIRVDYYDDFGTALSPSLGLNYELIEEELAVRGLVARNFRAPTFNDLYWPEGGNPNLGAERGVKSEIGVSRETKGTFNFNQQLSLFFIQMSDGIKWLPDSNGDFRAQNIEEITSRGLEWSGEISTRLGKWNLSSNHGVSYTRAFFSEKRFGGDQAKGNQLPYVPHWKYNGSIQANRSAFSAMLNSVFVDERFTTEQANSATAADAYLVFDGSLSYQKDIAGLQVSLTGKVNNIFNERYNVVRFYPMPLRNFLINLTITQKF